MDPEAPAPVDLAGTPAFTLGGREVDPPHRLIRRPDGTSELIEPRVMQVLVLLARANGGVVSRATLNARCWGGRAVSDDALDRVASKLRRVALAVGGFRIVTVPRVGFRLEIEPVTGGTPPAPAPVPAEGATPLAGPRGLDRRLVLGGGALAAAAAFTGWRAWRGGRTVDPGGIPRVAVLPFENLSPDPLAGFVAAAVSREVRDQLSRVSGLRVIAEPSSRSVSAKELSPVESAARLGANWLVQGSVREAGNHLRIGASLVEAAGGATLWSATQEGTSDTLFAMQDAIAGALLRELVGRIGTHFTTMPARPPRDGRVFRLVLEGRDLLEASRTARMEGRLDHAFDHADQAFALASQALAIDPADPGALLLVAQLTRNGWTRAMAAEPLSPEARVARSIAFVTRALASDPNDPAALTALGDYYRRFEWRFGEAETLFRRALALDPSSIETHWSYGYMLGTTGRALEGLEHARAVFTLDPETTWHRVALPRLLYLVGDRAGAFRRYDIELAETPANLFLITEIYIVHLSEGDPVGLRRLAGQVRALNGARLTTAKLTALVARVEAAVDAIEGRPAALLARIDADVTAYEQPARAREDQGRASIDLLYIAALEYAWAGADARAIAMLTRALAGKSLYWPATLPYGNAPFPARLRRDPRFMAVWRSGPGVIALVELRRRGLSTGQIAGYFADGRYVRPAPEAIRRSLAAA